MINFTYSSGNNSTSSGVRLEDLLNMSDKIKNPNGIENHVVHLDNFKPGTIMLYRQILPNEKPVEVSRMVIKEGQNRLSLDPTFKGVVIGAPKDESEKYHFEYVNYSEEEIKDFRKKEEIVNRK